MNLSIFRTPGVQSLQMNSQLSACRFGNRHYSHQIATKATPAARIATLTGTDKDDGMSAHMSICPKPISLKTKGPTHSQTVDAS
jgi:hypothetical protein